MDDNTECNILTMTTTFYCQEAIRLYLISIWDDSSSEYYLIL